LENTIRHCGSSRKAKRIRKERLFSSPGSGEEGGEVVEWKKNHMVNSSYSKKNHKRGGEKKSRVCKTPGVNEGKTSETWGLQLKGGGIRGGRCRIDTEKDQWSSPRQFFHGKKKESKKKGGKR